MEDDVAVSGGEPQESPTSVAQRWALIAGLISLLVTTSLVGWLGWRAGLAHDADLQRGAFIEAARRTAVELTTIDYQHVEDDVQGVLDSATGDFYRRFSRSSRLLIDTATRDRSQSVGSVTEVGVESQSDGAAKVLVALSVASNHLGGLELRPHELRLRLTVQRVGGEAKTSEVEYLT